MNRHESPACLIMHARHFPATANSLLLHLLLWITSPCVDGLDIASSLGASTISISEPGSFLLDLPSLYSGTFSLTKNFLVFLKFFGFVRLFLHAAISSRSLVVRLSMTSSYAR